MHNAKGMSMNERGFQNDDEVTKMYEKWQCPMRRARVNNLVKWDRGSGTNIHSKQARVLQYKSDTTIPAMSEEPVCRSCHWAVKNTKNTA